MPLVDVSSSEERGLQDVADILAGSHKILLITGAGISTSIGIPDFRSKDGLYNLIPEQNLPPTPESSRPSTPTKKRKAPCSDDEDELSSSQSSTCSRRSSKSTTRLRGQDLFDARVFQNAHSTTLFYRFIASLRQKIHDEVKDTSGTHKFVRTLRDGGRLMRCYTQNIDSLEAREGLCTDLRRGTGNKRRFMKKHYEEPRPDMTKGTDFDGGCEVVQLHGDLETLRCDVCATQFTWTDNETELFEDGFAPRCQKCSRKSDARQATGKRGLSVGSLRPNIVLYGEDHPCNAMLAPFVPFDTASQPDVLVIMGTSLKVFGLQKVVREFAKAVHGQKKGKVIFVNRTRPAESVWDGFLDYFVQMDCDGWVDDLRQRRPDLFLHQGHIDLKTTKAETTKRKRKSEESDSSSVVKRPAKKPKILVEIPATMLSVIDTSQPPPTTPKHQRFDRKPLSPNANGRPTHSPLSRHFKMIKGPGGQQWPGSPIRPTYSPITPKHLKHSTLRNEIYCDPEQNPALVGTAGGAAKSVTASASESDQENMPNPLIDPFLSKERSQFIEEKGEVPQPQNNSFIQRLGGFLWL